jgi:hypothetical protein
MATALLALLMMLPTAPFNGTVVSSSDGAPPLIAPGTEVRVTDEAVWFDVQAYPVWFHAVNGPLETWWFSLPMRPDSHRGWISLQPAGAFDGVYGNWTSAQIGPYWKFMGVTHAPEPAIAMLAAAGWCVLNNGRRRRCR